jgi:hypothetical protein
MGPSTTISASAECWEGPYLNRELEEENGGTHAVMGSIFVKKDGTEEDVEAGIQEGLDEIEGM